MRKFSSYGPLNTERHYYALRKALLQATLTQLVGEPLGEDGHYITVWGPRQVGKTWLMVQTVQNLQNPPYAKLFDVVVIPLEHLKMQPDVNQVIQSISSEVIDQLGLDMPPTTKLQAFYDIFKRGALKKPLILILDEFDALAEEAINGILSVFRNIYIRRQYQVGLPSAEKDYLLHSVALIGVRAALGVDNASGSPFNIQRSLHIPNLTLTEVRQMFEAYQQESGQAIEPALIERLFYETQGQPGLIGWFGELLTETYNHTPNRPITMANFEEVFAAATHVLPNNYILNIISKARRPPYNQFVLELFKIDKTMAFEYDQPEINYLYLNGVIDLKQVSPTEFEARFSSPFVQKRLFNYFSTNLFHQMGRLHDPFDNLSDIMTGDSLHIPNLIRRYETYLHQNRDWLFKDAPRRTDLRIYEAVYHFNLYMYLVKFLQSYDGQVYPEFPTGNGKIDLIINYSGQTYGLELKSFTSQKDYRQALQQAAEYGRQLQLTEIWLVFFVETVDETNRSKYEVDYLDPTIGVSVRPIFVQTLDP